MLPAINYRNGRYQGQIKDKLPHGVGILIDKDYLFCLAEWRNGEIDGCTFILFPSNKIFCGKISHRKP
jgi:hypothetical protein